MTTLKSEPSKPCHKSIISAERQDKSVILASCLVCGWEKEIPYYCDSGVGGGSTAWDEAEEWFEAHVKARQDALLDEPSMEMLPASNIVMPDLFEEREI